MPGSRHFWTQQEINFKVSFFTVLIEATSGCLVTASPDDGGRVVSETHDTTANHLPPTATALEIFSLKHL